VLFKTQNDTVVKQTTNKFPEQAKFSRRHDCKILSGRQPRQVIQIHRFTGCRPKTILHKKKN